MYEFIYNEVFDAPNPISERVVLSEVTSLEVDAGWRGIEETQKFIDVLRGQFDELGYSHLTLKPVHRLRRGMIIINGIIYKISLGEKNNDAALRYLKNLKQALTPTIEWCEANCSGKFALDQNGFSFANHDDYVLFKLRFLPARKI